MSELTEEEGWECESDMGEVFVISNLLSLLELSGKSDVFAVLISRVEVTSRGTGLDDDTQ